MRALHVISIHAESDADFRAILGPMLDAFDSPRHVERYAERVAVLNSIRQRIAREN